MALAAEPPPFVVNCDHQGCDEPAVVQVGVAFACATHATLLAQDILNFCKSYFIKKSRQLF